MKRKYLAGFYPLVIIRGASVFVQHEISKDKVDEITETTEINFRDFYPETFQRDKLVSVQREVADEILSGMTTINLRYLCANEILRGNDSDFIIVQNDVADLVLSAGRYQKSCERTMRRHNVLSIDAEDGIEEVACTRKSTNPEVLLEIKERNSRLYRALDTLPETQARRIDAHYLQGMTRKEIASKEYVSESSVNESIERGLKALKIILRNI